LLFAFPLEDITRPPEPVPARGSLGLWNFDQDAAGVQVLVIERLF